MIHVGFSKGSSVNIPLLHTIVAAQTRYGKSTAIRAMMQYVPDNFKVVCLDVKDPRDFAGAGTEIPIYIENKTDPLMLKQLLEQESHLWLRREFPELIDLCKEGDTFEKVYERVKARMEEKVHPVVRDRLKVLRLLLKTLTENMAKIELSDTLELPAKNNVMNLSKAPGEIKQLAVYSAVKWVLEKLEKVILVIDELPDFCLSENTEILTRDGWKKQDEIEKGEKVLTFNIDGDFLEYQPVRRVLRYNYNGEMLHLKGRAFDILMTPEHRVLLQRQYRPSPFMYQKGKKFHWLPYEYRSAENLPRQIRIPVASKFDGDAPSPSDELVKLLCWVITEGHVDKPHHKGYVRITQSEVNKTNVEEITSLIKTLNLGYCAIKRRVRERRGKKNISVEFRFGAKASEYILKLLDNHIHRIPHHLLNLPYRQLLIIYETLMKGDGSFYRLKNNPNAGHTFNPGLNKGLADDFQELCIKIGVRALVSKESNQYHVNLSERYPFVSVNSTPTRVAYQGIVWDVTTKNGNFIARRNGKPFITGNCPQRYRTPSKNMIGQAIRKGGAKGIWLWLSGQTMTGVDKQVLKQAMIWILGHQREINEAKRTLDQIPFKTGLKVEDIMTLPIGHFIVCTDEGAYITYVQPEGVNEDVACQVSLGQISVNSVIEALKNKQEDDDLVWKEKYEELEKTVEALRKQNEDMRKANLDKYHGELEKLKKHAEFLEAKYKGLTDRYNKMEGELKLYDEFRSVFRRIFHGMYPKAGFEPATHGTVELQPTQTILVTETDIKHAKVSGSTIRGKILTLAKTGFFGKWQGLGDVHKGLIEKFGWTLSKASLDAELGRMVKDFLLGVKKHPSRKQKVYRLSANVKFKEAQ